MRTATLYHGDVLAVLAVLPEASVQCCVTSPPYWGLRDYKLPPQIWDGEPGCAHEWAEESIATEVGRGNWAQGVNGRGEEQEGGVNGKREPVRAVATRGFCRLCGAWLEREDLTAAPSEPSPAEQPSFAGSPPRPGG